MSLSEIFPNINANDGWGNSLKKFVPNFIEYAQKKTPIALWQDEDREQFLASENCVSSLKQGNFSHNQRKAIIDNWEKEFSELLFQIVSYDDFQIHAILVNPL